MHLIVCIELSLLRRKYLPSAVIVLTKNLKSFHVTKITFPNSIIFTVTCEHGKDAGVETESVFWPICHAACGKVISNGAY